MVTKTTPPSVEPSQPKIADHFSFNTSWDRYDKNVQAAARLGKISNAEPLIRTLNADIRVFNGLAVLIEIVRNDAMLRDQFDESDAYSIKPLGDNATDALLSLASEICIARSQDICGMAEWVEKHIESREGK